jgi:hypothetical protein
MEEGGEDDGFWGNESYGDDEERRAGGGFYGEG